IEHRPHGFRRQIGLVHDPIDRDRLAVFDVDEDGLQAIPRRLGALAHVTRAATRVPTRRRGPSASCGTLARLAAITRGFLTLHSYLDEMTCARRVRVVGAPLAHR